MKDPGMVGQRLKDPGMLGQKDPGGGRNKKDPGGGGWALSYDPPSGG